MEGKVEVEAVLAGKKSSFPEDMEGKDAIMPVVAAAASPAAIVFGFLAPPLSLLRHVACLCAGYLGLDLDGGLKPSAPGTSSSSSSSSSIEDEDCTELVVEVRSRGIKPPNKPFSTPMESRVGAGGGKHQ